MPFRIGIKAKQVIGVTLVVAVATAALTTVYLGVLVRVWLQETEARGELVVNSAFQRAFAVAASDKSGDLAAALRNDGGLKSILEAALYDKSITFAAITDTQGRVIAHNDPSLLDTPLATNGSLGDLIRSTPLTQFRAIFSKGGETYDVSREIQIDGGSAFGAIHVGVSTLLIRGQIEDATGELRWPVLGVLAATVLIAMLLANLVVRPISVISSNVARLGRGEFDAASGDLDLPDDAELKHVSESIKAIGARLAAGGGDDARRIVALSRLSAGIAHEIKNPLNAISIHLELLRAEIGGQRPAADHLQVIKSQLSRLDEVVQTFLKFSRPEPLALRPVSLVTMLAEIRPIVEAEAEPSRVRVEIVCASRLPEVMADAASLQNALLNLALNGCQAMPQGGTLRITAEPAAGNKVTINVHDTGIGIPSDQLDKIFNLYFTTKEGGSGIGLAMVYRTVQLHNGDIKVESASGRGTTFTLTLSAAS